jgi:WXXGXW repeat (2 copies)
MLMRNMLLCMAIALGSAAIPSGAGAAVVIEIGVPPPAPRFEAVPPPRGGYIWAPGYWRWQGEQHVWVGGRWKRERSGSHWVAERWEDRGGRHHFEPGRWERDAEPRGREHERDHR